MKRLVLLAALSLTLTAHAGDAEEAMIISSQCQDLAIGSAGAYQARIQGQKQYIPTKAEVGMLYPLVKFSEDYGFNRATSEKDAYMVTYGKCLDNYRWLTDRIRAKHPIPDELHY